MRSRGVYPSVERRKDGRDMKRTLVVVVGMLSTVALAAPARAHHEAIFGPQSSLVLSAPSYASVQTFSRQLGTAGARTQESTMLLSAGVTPFARFRCR